MYIHIPGICLYHTRGCVSAYPPRAHGSLSPEHVTLDFFFFKYFPVPFNVSALLLPCSVLVATQIRGSHKKTLLRPRPHYGACLAFLSREDFSSFFPRRLASNCLFVLRFKPYQALPHVSWYPQNIQLTSPEAYIMLGCVFAVLTMLG